MTRIIIGILIIVIGLSALIGVSLFKFAFALTLIIIGIRIITGVSWQRSHWGRDRKATTTEDFLNEVAIFSPLDKTVRSEGFRGGKIVVVFGGGQIDISQVKAFEKNVNIELTAVFGGAKLIIPKNWRVNSQGVGIFGGYSNKAVAAEGETTLSIKGAAIFGGVEIIN